MMYVLQCHADQSGTWYEFDEKSALVTKHDIVTLADCPRIDVDAYLVVLLPGQSVRMTQLTLPKMRASERLRAIPFALEEELAADPGQVDVALGATTAEGELTVAIFDKTSFQSQLDLLNDQSLFAHVVLPDFLAVLWEESTWSVCACKEMTLVRTGYQTGFAADADNIPLLLKLALEEAAKNNKTPEKIVCYLQESMIDTTKLEVLDVPIVFHDTPEGGVFDFLSLLKTPAINMLQGAYRPKHKVSAYKRNWWIAVGVAILWVVILLGGHIAQWVYYSHKQNELSASVLKTYQTIFPSAKSVLEPRFRVEEELKRLKAAEQSSTFLRMLSAVGALLNQYATITLQQIHFENAKLTIQITAPNTTTLSQFTAAMRQSGLTVNQQVANPLAATIQATLTIAEVS